MSNDSADTGARSGISQNFKDSIGLRSMDHRFDVTESRIRDFCRAVATPFRGEAPPTFLTIFRDGEFDICQKLGIPVSRLIHGDQEYRYQNAILPGDAILYETVVTKAFEKTGHAGTLRFLALETQYRARREGQELPIALSKTTLLVR